MHVESMSDTSTPSVSPVTAGKLPLGLYPPPDMSSPGVHALAVRDEYTRPSSAVRLYRPSSRKGVRAAVGADGQA